MNNLFEFELPPVSETEEGFIEPEPENDFTPDVSNDGIEPIKTETESEPEKDYRGLMSPNGKESFDPSIHKAPPSATKLGNWRKLTKKQREKGEVKSETHNAVFEIAGQKTAINYGNLHQFLFPDAKIDLQEVKPLADAWTRYYQEKGLKESSPLLDVLLNSAGYSVGISAREKNTETTKQIVGLVKEKSVSAFHFITFNKFKKKTAKIHDIKSGNEIKPNEVKENETAQTGEGKITPETARPKTELEENL